MCLFVWLFTVQAQRFYTSFHHDNLLFLDYRLNNPLLLLAAERSPGSFFSLFCLHVK